MREDESCYKSVCPAAWGQTRACSLFVVSNRAWQTMEQSVQKDRMTQETFVSVQEVINWTVLSGVVNIK
jgi:hypothetical protein